MRELAVLALTLCALVTVAAAQVPTSGNVFFGYSYYNTDLSNLGRTGLNGWEGSLEGKVLPGVGIVADITGHYGSQNAVNPSATCVRGGVCGPLSVGSHVYEAMFRPRFYAPFGKLRPFAEFEFGVGHIITNGLGSDTSFAMAFGGGLDYRIFRPLAWRLQADYVGTHFFNLYQSSARTSTGIVFRF